jgi:hypothetical protein
LPIAAGWENDQGLSSASRDMNPPTASGPSHKERLPALLAEYGPIFFVIYFGLFFTVLFCFAWAIRRGFGHVIDEWMAHSWLAKVAEWLPGGGARDGAPGWLSRIVEWLWGKPGEREGASSAVGILVAAYVATKLTTPLRLAAAIGLTRLVGSRRRRAEPPAQAIADEVPRASEPTSRG